MKYIGKFDIPASEDFLIKALDDRGPQVPPAAVYCLGEKRSKRAAKIFLERYKEKKKCGLREGLWEDEIIALGKIGDPSAIGPIIESKRQGKFSNVREVVEALGHFNSPEAIEAIIVELGNYDDLVRRKARHSLIQIGKPAIKQLEKALNSQDEMIRKEAKKTLAVIKERLESNGKHSMRT